MSKRKYTKEFKLKVLKEQKREPHSIPLTISIS